MPASAPSVPQDCTENTGFPDLSGYPLHLPGYLLPDFSAGRIPLPSFLWKALQMKDSAESVPSDHSPVYRTVPATAGSAQDLSAGHPDTVPVPHFLHRSPWHSGSVLLLPSAHCPQFPTETGTTLFPQFLFPGPGNNSPHSHPATLRARDCSWTHHTDPEHALSGFHRISLPHSIPQKW